MGRLARGVTLAAAASLALHAGLLATTLGDEATGSAKSELAYLRTRLVVAPDAVEVKATQPTEPAATETQNTAAELPRADTGRPAEAAPAVAAQNAVMKTMPSEAARASEPIMALERAAEEPEPPSPLPPPTVAARPANAVAGGAASPAAAPLAGSGADPGPALLSDLVIERPVGAGRQGGTVTLLLVLSAQGTVAKASVLQSTPPGLFDEATLKAIGTARFKPALRGSVAIQAETVYEVEISPLR